MAASEGDGTPRRPPPHDEEEEYGVTPAPSSADATPLPASESSLDQAVLARQADARGPANLQDLARTRRTIGKSLKNMHEEFSQLLTATQQECATRIDSVVQLLTKDREVTQELLKVESQKREALERRLEELAVAPLPGLADPTTSSESASFPGAWTSMLEELLDSRINTLVSTVRVELEQLRSETSAAMDSLSDAVQQHHGTP